MYSTLNILEMLIERMQPFAIAPAVTNRDSPTGWNNSSSKFVAMFVEDDSCIELGCTNYGKKHTEAYSERYYAIDTSDDRYEGNNNDDGHHHHKRRSGGPPIRDRTLLHFHGSLCM